MKRNLTVIALVAALSAATGCESATDEHGAAAGHVVEGEATRSNGVIAPTQFDLEATAALIRDGRVDDAKDLEVQINGSAHQVDVDRDGKRDRLQVVEVREEQARRFDVRALPSSKKKAKPGDIAVPIATIGFVREDDAAEVTLKYTDAPILITFELPLVIGSFCHWVLVVERPIFVGVGYVIVYDRQTHKKHKKHKK